MADKGKVLAAIELKFKGKSLTKNFKDNLATKWAAKIENDEGIDAFITDREEDVLEASTEADRRATAATAKAKADAAAAVTGKPETPKEETPDELPPDTPAWAKALMQQNKALADKVDSFEKQKQTETLTGRFHKSLRDAGVPDTFIKYAPIPKDESEIEALQAQIVADAKPFIEQAKAAGFGADAPPAGGGNGKNGASKVDPDIVAFGKKINEAAIQTAKN